MEFSRRGRLILQQHPEPKAQLVYRGPLAPLTCLALSESVVFAGCWDKSIWSWNIDTNTIHRRLMGHSDFVKAVLFLKLGGRATLVSGGADAQIIVWDSDSGEKLHVLKGHARGVETLAIDPMTSTAEEIKLFSAGSDREVRQWKLRPHSAQPVEGTTSILTPHETSIYSLRFDMDGDLWTASADKTCKKLVREGKAPWTVGESFEHPDFVRDVAITDRWVVTACRDEHVRVWDQSSGKLWHVYEGHYDEVTVLLVLPHANAVVSASIDATIRRWSLDPKDLQKAKREAEEASRGNVEEVVEEEGEKSKALMTAEEEAELAELMDGD